MAYKNPLRLAKNSHFFVSDVTTLTSYVESNTHGLEGLHIETFCARSWAKKNPAATFRNRGSRLEA
jgi:hypothetical protein